MRNCQSKKISFNEKLEVGTETSEIYFSFIQLEKCLEHKKYFILITRKPLRCLEQNNINNLFSHILKAGEVGKSFLDSCFTFI